MDKNSIFLAGSTQGCRWAGVFLQDFGVPVTDVPEAGIRYLLLDVPSFGPNGLLRGGGNLNELLCQLPRNVMVCGGNLNHPCLDDYQKADFLLDEEYLCQNAYITAECALDTALPYLSRTIRNCPILILGWGRIGKCLGRLLKSMGAEVTIAARNPAHRAMIHALGYHVQDFETLPETLGHFRLLYNTIPCPVLGREQLALCQEDCVKIELASKDGIVGDDIIIARGLPGIHMPESSGKLIAETFMRLCYGR